MHQHTVVHWTTGKHILRYPRHTITHGRVISPTSFANCCYFDADWAGDSNDQRSAGVFSIFLGFNLFHKGLKKKKQRIVARSSTESEYEEVTNTTCKLICFKVFFWSWAFFSLILRFYGLIIFLLFISLLI